MTETHDPMNEIVQELRKIKVFTGMTGIALTVMLIFTILSSLISIGALALIMPSALKAQSSILEKRNSSSFSDKTKELVEQGKMEEALSQIAIRRETHPNDPYTYYYEAKIQLAQDEPEKALLTLEKTLELAPKWEKEYIAPLVKVAESRINRSKQN